MTTIKNDILVAEISSDPFELTSLQKEGKEYVYQKEGVWKKSWPLCFPIVGGLVNNTYTIDNKKYKLKKHGFFRDITNWGIISESINSAKWRYISTERFKDEYPYDFTLDVSYLLDDNKLLNNIKIFNDSKQDMYYTFGFHPAFVCSALEAKISFEQPEQMFLVPSDGFLEEPSEIKQVQEIMLKDLQFANSETYMVVNHKSDYVILDDNHRKVKISTLGFDSIAIWKANNESNYICIEPWIGHQDVKNSEKDLSLKPWFKSIKPNQFIEYTLEIEILN